MKVSYQKRGQELERWEGFDLAVLFSKIQGGRGTDELQIEKNIKM